MPLYLGSKINGLAIQAKAFIILVTYFVADIYCASLMRKNFFLINLR